MIPFKFNFDNNDIIKNNSNEYLNIDFNSSFYIRNFCNSKNHVEFDNIFDEKDLLLLNNNSILNREYLNSNLFFNKYQYYSAAVIIGNNNIDEKYLSNKYLKIGINSSLKRYCEILDIYCNNNPYQDPLKFLPDSIPLKWPDGLFSYRVNPRFLSLYKGNRNGYNTPVCIHGNYPIIINNNITLEDHRSIILTIFDLCFKLGIKDIILLNTENYLKEKKEGSIYINQDIYMYPQQILDMSIISAGAFWLQKNGINVYTIKQDFNFINSINLLEE